MCITPRILQYAIRPPRHTIGFCSHITNEGCRLNCPVIKAVTEKLPHESHANAMHYFGRALRLWVLDTFMDMSDFESRADVLHLLRRER